MSEDPIGFAGGDYNLYRYVGNRPIVDTDPSGLFIGQAVTIVGRVAIGIAAGVGLAKQCSKVEEPPKDQALEAAKQQCEANKSRQLQECSNGQHSKEICESIAIKVCN